MTTQELMIKLKEIEKDEDFMKELFELDSIEKIKDAFASKELYLSTDEVKVIVSKVVDATEEKGELSENFLENVSGGIVITSAMVGWGCAALLAAGGTIIGWKLAKGKC